MFFISLTKQSLDNDAPAITKLVAQSCELGTRESLSFAKEEFDYSKGNGEWYGSCFMYNSCYCVTFNSRSHSQIGETRARNGEDGVRPSSITR